jgi:hypothetical protein
MMNITYQPEKASQRPKFKRFLAFLMSLLVFLGAFGLFKPETAKAGGIYHLTYDAQSGYYLIPPEISDPPIRLTTTWGNQHGWFIMSDAGDAMTLMTSLTTVSLCNGQEYTSGYWSPSPGNLMTQVEVNGKLYYFLITSTYCAPIIKIAVYPNFGNVYLSYDPFDTIAPKISLLEPSNNNIVSEGKSNFWKISLEGLSTIPNLPQFVSLRVNYWNINFPDIIYRDEVYPVLIPENPSDFSTYLDKNTPLTNGEYQAQAELILSDNTIYKSEINYFVIIGGASPSPSPPVYPSMSPYPSTPPELSPPPYAGSEEICQSPPGGFLDYPVQNLTFAICKAFTFLFLPSESQRDTLSSFLNNWSDNLKKKPPFGYFYLIKSAFSGVDTTATSTEYNFEIPVIGDTLKQAIVFLFWLIAVAYVIIRIKSIL